MKKETFKKKLIKVLAILGIIAAFCVACYQNTGIGLVTASVTFLAVRYIPFFILMHIYYGMEIKPIVSVINTTLFLTTTAMSLLAAGVAYFFYEPAMAVVLGIAVFLLTTPVLYYFTFPEVTRNMTKAQIIHYRKTSWIYRVLYHNNMFVGQWAYIQKSEREHWRRLVDKYNDDARAIYLRYEYDDENLFKESNSVDKSLTKEERLERFEKYSKQYNDYRSYDELKDSIEFYISKLEELKKERKRYINRKLKREQCDETAGKIISKLQEEAKALEKLVAERGAKYRRIVFMSM